MVEFGFTIAQKKSAPKNPIFEELRGQLNNKTYEQVTFSSHHLITVPHKILLEVVTSSITFFSGSTLVPTDNELAKC